jgi:pSer/pThr/pTyr-binding forkhead associated (FHA) protein
MPLTLIETRPDSSLRSHRFDGLKVVLGRDDQQCQLVIDKADWPMVSRKHAELMWRDGALYLQDAQSTSGKF